MFYYLQLGLSWRMFHVSLRQIYILLLLDGLFCNADETKMIDSVIIQVIYTLIVFCLINLLITNIRGIEVSKYNSGFFYFSF